ncbi:type II toxin-antitoxin system PemK/MazF family toxin [Actinomyces oris]|uniref:type II toxin-antitoxin system PemK/MazF family toxin n=1 Tax=Actinomyces oris TaxID=544580 RepID=UPI00094DD908|nr:type II toxin-antitoxin system PemK/MazF family toxin [Actinomyces oris]OLO62936.1 growth inhibitor PemK [Actinomyces oris]
MASLLNRILTLLGHAASDALAQKPSAPSGTSGSTPSGSAEPAQSRTPKSSAVPSSRGVSVYDVSALGLPAFSYSPDHPDGDADPGEVVWAWVPFEEDPTQGKDRPVLVLARHESRLVVAQMTSKDHDRDAAQEARWGRFWYDVGTGDWDRQGRPSEVRLDRLLLVEPASVRREGATMNREVFDGVVAALRHHHS